MKLLKMAPLLLVLLAGCGQEPVPAGTLNSVEDVIGDMMRCGEGIPHGVPLSYDWRACPRTSYGNDPREMTAVIPWGQVYQSADSPSAASNTRINLRHLHVWYLSKSRSRWIRWTGSLGVEGAHYVEDFSGDSSIAASSLRHEPDGSVSVRMIPGYNFHFWSTQGRASIQPDDIQAVWAFCEARLILDDPAAADDRSQAHYLLSAGADYWLTPTAQWSGFTTNGDIAIGRFKRIGTAWRAYNMHTASEALLRAQPPPLR